MSFKKFLISREFLIQIVIALLLVSVLIFATMWGLKKYTKHGESNLVPDFSGMMQNDAAQIAENQKLKTEVTDSVYVNDIPPGAVVDQIPEAGFKVKEGRTIFLTINSTQPELVTLPKLIDISFRQAQVLIENSGLEVGQISYHPSEYNDLVLNVRINSLDLNPGEKIAKGTKIDLIIGRTQGSLATPLPGVIGLSVGDAELLLKESMLNLGVLIYDETINTGEDSTNARVWKQSPDPAMIRNITLGSSVDIWITVDDQKIEETPEPEL